jgi:hypothetical protein
MNHHETALQDNGPGTTAWARCDCDWQSPPCTDLFDAAGAARRHLEETR